MLTYLFSVTRKRSSTDRGILSCVRKVHDSGNRKDFHDLSNTQDMMDFHKHIFFEKQRHTCFS